MAGAGVKSVKKHGASKEKSHGTPSDRTVEGQHDEAPAVPGMVPQPTPPHTPHFSSQHTSPDWTPGIPLVHVDAAIDGTSTHTVNKISRARSFVARERDTMSRRGWVAAVPAIVLIVSKLSYRVHKKGLDSRILSYYTHIPGNALWVLVFLF